MENLEDAFESILEETYQHYKVVHAEIEKADRDGRDVAHVIADSGTKRGDIIEISKFSEEGTANEDEEAFEARVLAVMPRTALDDSGDIVRCVEALCVVLKPGDVESLDDFAALYGDGDGDSDNEQEELELGDNDSEEPVELKNHICPCGANLQMCEKNQEVFGGHLND